MAKKIEVFGLNYRKDSLELVCDEETFGELARLVVDFCGKASTSEPIDLEQVCHIHIFTRRPPRNDRSNRWRDRIALFGCSLLTYALVFIGMACVSLMGLGLGVVAGWLKAG